MKLKIKFLQIIIVKGILTTNFNKNPNVYMFLIFYGLES